MDGESHEFVLHLPLRQCNVFFHIDLFAEILVFNQESGELMKEGYHIRTIPLRTIAPDTNRTTTAYLHGMFRLIFPSQMRHKTNARPQ